MTITDKFTDYYYVLILLLGKTCGKCRQWKYNNYCSFKDKHNVWSNETPCKYWENN